MRPIENRRYRQAASDYLRRPSDDPAVIALAWQACQAADLAAFEVLRQGGRQAEGRENRALSRDLAHL